MTSQSPNPKQIDPALLTLEEWMRIVDPSHKTHPDSAYDYSVTKMQNEWDKKEKYPHLLRHIKLAGLPLEIRVQKEPCTYVKVDQNGEIERIGNEIQYYTPEEAQRLGKRLEEISIGVFHEEQKIGGIQDEWGCVLIYVCAEYRNIGLGTILQKMARSMEPSKPSGGFTPSGRAGFARVHREFVRDALRDGKYMKMVKSGQMTMEEVKEIIRSAKVDFKPKKQDTRNLSSNNPADWVLFVGEYGDFILYDKKLKGLLNHEDGMDTDQADYFVESMIKGAVNIRSIELFDGNEYGLITLFGGDSDKIKQFMIKIALTYAKQEGYPLYIDVADLEYVPANGELIGKPNMKTGYKRQEVKMTGDPVMYNLLGVVESRFRRSFDKYDEFKDRFMELAYGKYRVTE